MTIKEIANELEYLTDETEKTWYAVHFDGEDQEDGIGSNDPEEAAKMAVNMDCHQIALIYDNGADETYNTVNF